MFFIYVGGPNLFIYFSCVILFVTRWKQKFCCASCSRISTLSWTWLSRLTWWSWRVWGREAVPGWHWRHAVTQIDTVWGLDAVPGWHWRHAVTQIDTVWGIDVVPGWHWRHAVTQIDTVWDREVVPGWHWRHAVTQIDTVWGLDVVPGWHWHHAVTQIDTVWWRCVCVCVNWSEHRWQWPWCLEVIVTRTDTRQFCWLLTNVSVCVCEWVMSYWLFCSTGLYTT